MTPRLPLTILAATFFGSSSHALESNVSKVTAASPAQAWEAIGDFCGISTWHPSVTACKISEVMGAKLRIVTFKDGRSIREQLVEQNTETMTQRSLFLDGALPVSNYQSTLRVVVTAGGTTFNWSGQFEANGVSDAEAAKRMASFYSEGIDGLVQESVR